MKEKIFIVDDEDDIREILEVNLINEGYDVYQFPSAKDALEKLEKLQPDLFLLDIMMEGMDGYEFCRTIRSSSKNKNIPIIFLSAKSEEFDKVLGLELGGDDFVTKPFGVKELLSRVKAVLRRSTMGANDEGKTKEDVIQYKGLELFPEKFQLKVDGEYTKLTKSEFQILQIFMENPGKIFSRDNIIDSIRGIDIFVVDRTIDVHIMNLRKKLGAYKNVITTFSGIGYGFKE